MIMWFGPRSRQIDQWKEIESPWIAPLYLEGWWRPKIVWLFQGKNKRLLKIGWEILVTYGKRWNTYPQYKSNSQCLNNLNIKTLKGKYKWISFWNQGRESLLKQDQKKKKIASLSLKRILGLQDGRLRRFQPCSPTDIESATVYRSDYLCKNSRDQLISYSTKTNTKTKKGF